MAAESVASRASGLAFVKREDNSWHLYTLVRMKGAVAAGHPLTAEAGAEVLRQGGNAVDACIAAAFVSWVAESPLTGPGAGGFMLVHRARDRSTRVLDHFAAVPGRGSRSARVQPMDEIEGEFTGGRSKQGVKIGAGPRAGPGAAPRPPGAPPD